MLTTTHPGLITPHDLRHHTAQARYLAASEHTRAGGMTANTFDPTTATFVHEIRIRARWRQEYACPSSRPSHAPHRLHLDKSGEVIGCSCEAWYFSKRGRESCPHSDRAAAIVAAATFAQLAALDDEDVAALATKHRTVYGTAGLANNPRADLVADEYAARLARRHGAATIARGRAAVSDLFDEAS